MQLQLRHLTSALLLLIAILLLAFIAWGTYEIVDDSRSTTWITQANRLADLAVKANVAQAAERGLTATIISGSSEMRDKVHERLAELRNRGDRDYANFLEAAQDFSARYPARSLTQTLLMLSRYHVKLVNARKAVDHAFEDPDVSIDSTEWIGTMNILIETLAQIRHQALVPLDRFGSIYWDNLQIKEMVFLASEYAGRERLIFSVAIARNRPITMDEFHTLQYNRAIVEDNLRRLVTQLQNGTRGPDLQNALDRLQQEFLGRFQQIRKSVYAASSSQESYPLDVTTWWDEATRGIDSILAVSTVVGQSAEQDIAALQQREVQSNMALIATVLIVVAILIFMIMLVRRRLIVPLRTLTGASTRIAGGNLDCPISITSKDEFGVLGDSFERMRVSLLQHIARVEQAERKLAIRARQQAVVAELAYQTLVGVELDALMNTTVRLVAKVLEIEYCQILECLPDQSGYLLRAGVGWDAGLVGKAEVEAGEHSQAGYTAAANEPVVVEDMDRETRFNSPPLHQEHGIRSGISVALLGKDQSFGVLGAYSAQKRIYSKDDTRFLQAVANTLAEAIERKLAVDALQRSEKRFAGIIDMANEAIISVDENQRIILFNQQAEQIFGYTADEIIGRPLETLIPKRVQTIHRRHVTGFSGGDVDFRKMENSRDELSGLRKNGEEFPARVSISKFELGNEKILTAVVKDVTVLKRTEQVIKNIVVGISSSIGDTFFEAITTQLAKTLGADFTIVGELTAGGESVRTLAVHALGKVADDFEYDLEHTPCTNVIGKQACVYACGVAEQFPQDEMLKDMGIEGYIGIPLFNSSGQALGLIAALFRTPIDNAEYIESIMQIFAEHTAAEIERKSMEGEMRYMAHYDALTGLPNRVLLLERMRESFQSAQRAGKIPTLMLINMSRFREINEVFGHQNGDLVLQEIASRLREVLLPEDCTIARLGGDEFAALFPSHTGEPPTTMAQKILDVLWEPFLIEGLTIALEANLGISVYSDHCKDESELLHQGDVAMQQAKQERSGYKLYAEDKNTSSLYRLVLFGELRHAIEHDELILYYQPKVEIKTGRIAGVEALVRWRHPEKGLIPPINFIPIAEQSGLIGPLSQWVLREALKQCTDWRDAGLRLKVAVNLSPRNLLDVNFPKHLAALLKINRVAPGDITLEITEDAIMDQPESAVKILNQLHEIGVGLSIDDFGTGNSSLAYLKQLPVDEVKLDKSFITHMDTDENDAVIVYAAINLAHNLNNRRVIAEGVETQEVWDLLQILGCDVVQGYFLSRPLPADELVRWLRQSPWTLDEAAHVSVPHKAAG